MLIFIANFVFCCVTSLGWDKWGHIIEQVSREAMARQQCKKKNRVT